jgi:NTE family protein
MNDAPSAGNVSRGAKRNLPFERVVLVLQGGGALGAYQAGVFAALDEANIQVDWLCGISIGAVNAALIAGNPPEKRIQALRRFWEAVTEPPLRFLPRLSDWPSIGDDQARTWANSISAFGTLLHGAPHFFSPRPLTPLGAVAARPDAVSFYDTSALKTTLAELVDFELLNSPSTHLSVGATNVRTGAPVYFDNLERKLTVAHIMAAASLPPLFPPTEIDGQFYYDGGVVSNSPMQLVIDRRPSYSALVFQVDLWDAHGELPLDLTAANLRGLEIHSASRINISLEKFRREQNFRRAVSRLLEYVPKESINDPDIQMISEEARVQTGVLVHLKYQSKPYETASKIFEFSRRAMEEHWQAGFADTTTALNEPAVLQLPDPSEHARIYDVHCGWIE